jgi:hypothetical protein
MSKMFKDAVEAHIEQLKSRIHSADPKAVEEEIRTIEPALTRTSDPALRKALERRLATLKSLQTGVNGRADDYKRILSAVQSVYSLIKERPEYNVKRAKRGEGRARRRAVKA